MEALFSNNPVSPGLPRKHKSADEYDQLPCHKSWIFGFIILTYSFLPLEFLETRSCRIPKSYVFEKWLFLLVFHILYELVVFRFSNVIVVSYCKILAKSHWDSIKPHLIYLELISFQTTYFLIRYLRCPGS